MLVNLSYVKVLSQLTHEPFSTLCDQNVLAHGTMVALDSANFLSTLFHMTYEKVTVTLFRQQFTIQIKIFWSHKYFVVSARAPIVEALKSLNFILNFTRLASHKNINTSHKINHYKGVHNHTCTSIL